MNFVTQDKLVLIGAAGMIGSNMAQTTAMMHLTPSICLYDPSARGLEGVREEMRHCDFEGLNLTFTSDIAETLRRAKYIVSSGDTPRKEGMTRENLLKGNSEVAAELGRNIKKYCSDVHHAVIIFNPADITGLVTLVRSGLKPSQVTTLAALGSTHLQGELAKHFGLQQSQVTNTRTYGGHGEQMAVFASTARVDGTPFTDLIGTDRLTHDDWAALHQRVIKGGANIIALRGRSSFQSPAYVSIEVIRVATGGEPFRWSAGYSVRDSRYKNVMMTRETTITRDGVVYRGVKGLPNGEAALDKSHKHLQAIRDQIIQMGTISAVADWYTVNPNL